MRSDMHNNAVDHMPLLSAFTIMPAPSSKRTSTRAISRSSRLFTRPHVAPRDRTTVRLSNGHSLLRQWLNATATAWDGSRVLSLKQPPAVAAKDVFCGLQVTDLESFPHFFPFHLIFPFCCFGLP